IPENISNYNDAGMYERLEASINKYSSWQADAEKSQGKTNDMRAACCTDCKECESKCPQNIPISKWMSIIHNVMAEGKPYIKRVD
ncbi:MAG: 4Fe-4S dicluster domain-containing protein, partial [Dethiobacteria bacterium]|nr:4Fe-4S dicluster domain-containing protein [Dethiobacteria bacterium]